MRILHVIPSLSPASGGPAEALRQLSHVYPEIGVEAEIVCHDQPADQWIEQVAGRVHTLGASSGAYSRYRSACRWLRDNIARFNGVVAHSIWNDVSVAVAREARGRVPYAVFTHGMLDPWFRRRYPLKHLKKYLYWPIQYPALRDAKSVLFTSTIERDLAPESFWPNKWTSLVVPYGTNEPPANVAAQRQALERVLPRLAGRPFLLFLSRIHEKKGCDLLVEAFASLAQQHPEIDLVIAGPDQNGLQANLAALAARLKIAERIHWPGMLTGDAKWGTLRACEAMILPSHQENFGVIVAEALACGRPVLISNQVNVWPEIEADRTGLVEPDTREGARALLTRWLGLSDEEQAAMASRALPSFRKRFSMKNCALAIRDLFSH